MHAPRRQRLPSMELDELEPPPMRPQRLQRLSFMERDDEASGIVQQPSEAAAAAAQGLPASSRSTMPRKYWRQVMSAAAMLALFVLGARFSVADDGSFGGEPTVASSSASLHASLPRPPASPPDGSMPPPPLPALPPDVPVGSPRALPPYPTFPPPRVPPPAPIAPSPSPPSPPWLEWVEYPGKRCWHEGHGGKPLGGFLTGAPGLALARAEQCKASCATDEALTGPSDFACVGVVWDTRSFTCYKYRELIIGLCSDDDPYTTFIRADRRVPPPPTQPPFVPHHFTGAANRSGFAARLNARYMTGEASADLFNAGVLVHQFDFMDDGDPRGSPWVPGKVWRSLVAQPGGAAWRRSLEAQPGGAAWRPSLEAQPRRSRSEESLGRRPLPMHRSSPCRASPGFRLTFACPAFLTPFLLLSSPLLLLRHTLATAG